MPEKSLDRKRAVKVSLNRKLWEEARALGINISQACEIDLRATVERARAEEAHSKNVAG
jgi:post-segregation antitoxin (ccd killing protein)